MLSQTDNHISRGEKKLYNEGSFLCLSCFLFQCDLTKVFNHQNHFCLRLNFSKGKNINEKISYLAKSFEFMVNGSAESQSENREGKVEKNT